MLNTLMRWQAGVNAAENQIDPRELFMMLFGGDAFHHIFGDVDMVAFIASMSQGETANLLMHI